MEKELYKAAVMTFEELGFMLPTPELEERQQNAPVEAAVSLEFQGPFSGRMIVRVCGDVLSTLAANMLGEEEPPLEELQLDALKEMANVISGNALPAIAGSKDDIFYLGSAQKVECTDGVFSEPPVAEARIGLEEGRADVLLFMSGALKEEGH